MHPTTTDKTCGFITRYERYYLMTARAKTNSVAKSKFISFCRVEHNCDMATADEMAVQKLT